MKRTILMLTVVSLLVAIPALAKNNVPGDVPAPADLTYTIIPAVDEPPTPEMVKFVWVAEPQAEKYSLDIEGAGWVTIVDATEDVWVEFSVSYSAMESELTMPVQDVLDDLTAAILAELGVEMEDVLGGELVEMIAKVKGLDPQDKLDSKRQNNLFSADLDLLPLF